MYLTGRWICTSIYRYTQSDTNTIQQRLYIKFSSPVYTQLLIFLWKQIFEKIEHDKFTP